MNTHSVTESAKSLANGASRELQAVNRRVAQASTDIAHVVSEQGAALMQNAAAGLRTASRSAKQHPWIASAAVVAGLAALGGYLFSRRVRQQQETPTPRRRRNNAAS